MFMTIRYTELLCCLPCDVVFNLSKLLAAIFTSNSGCIVDSKQDDCSTRKGNRQPWVCVLLGLQGKPTNNTQQMCECDVENLCHLSFVKKSM